MDKLLEGKIEWNGGLDIDGMMNLLLGIRMPPDADLTKLRPGQKVRIIIEQREKKAKTLSMLPKEG